MPFLRPIRRWHGDKADAEGNAHLWQPGSDLRVGCSRLCATGFSFKVRKSVRSAAALESFAASDPDPAGEPPDIVRPHAALRRLPGRRLIDVEVRI
jgi:hypothetical protein